MGLGDMIPESDLLSVADTHLLEAVIASDPADTTEQVMVIIPVFDEDQLEGPCPWLPRIVDGSTYGIPSKGDRALVVMSEDQEPWVAIWWPTEE